MDPSYVGRHHSEDSTSNQKVEIITEDQERLKLYEISNEKFEVFINHIFLPRKIENYDLKTDHIFMESILDFLIETIHNFHRPLSTSTLDLFSQMRRVYQRDGVEQTINISEINLQLNSLQPGKMFGLFLHAQNCGFVAYSPKNGQKIERVVSTFQGSLQNEIITSHEGDIQVISNISDFFKFCMKKLELYSVELMTSLNSRLNFQRNQSAFQKICSTLLNLLHSWQHFAIISQLQLIIKML